MIGGVRIMKMCPLLKRTIKQIYIPQKNGGGSGSYGTCYIINTNGYHIEEINREEFLPCIEDKCMWWNIPNKACNVTVL